MARPPKDMSSVLGREDDHIEEDGIVLAGIGRSAARRTAKAILEPLTEKGSRIDPDAVTTDEPIAKDVDAPIPEETPPLEELPRVDPVVEPKIKKPKPATQEQVDEVIKARDEALETPRTVPSPSAAQKAEGIVAGPVNTRFYDSDQLAATVKAIAETDTEEFKSKSVESIYQDAIRMGVPKSRLDKMFKGVPMTSKIGDNQLARQLAGLQALHDASAQRVDDLMAQAQSGLLTDLGKFELREALAQHQIIYSELKGAKQDVARSMNVFKGARERNMPSLDIRAVLDGVGGDDQLRVLAENYMQADTRAGKNKILEVGLLRKSYESVIYMAQSVFLMNPDTHMYNAVANTLSTIMDLPERAAAIPIGKTRQRIAKLTGMNTSPDRYTNQDIYARATGFYNGLLDGFMLAGRSARQGAAKDAPRNPVSSDYLSNTPLFLLGKEIARTPELKNTSFGRAIDALGTVYSMPMRALAAGDGFSGGLIQRVELHEQAWRHGAKIFDEALARGESDETAMNLAQDAVGRLLSERPHDIEASMNAVRKQITLMTDIDRSTALGRIYAGTQKVMNFPLVKPIALFSKSVTNLAIEGAARIPGLNFLSPRFYSEWQKGGRHRDLAISRIALGGSMGLGSYYLAYNGRITGAGPSATEDRNALKASGWQEFSLEFGEGEISSPVAARLKQLLGEDAVTIGTGSNAGKTYVSFKRLEPVTIPFLMGAAFADAMKYNEYDPDDTQKEIMFNAMMASLSEYSVNQPAMQSFNEIMRIVGQRQTDGGDRFVAVIDAYLRQVANVGMAGTPVVGLANNALFAKIERIMNPEASQTAVTQEQVEWADEFLGLEADMPGVRAFFEAYNKMMSRVPVMSEGVEALRDARGHKVGTNTMMPAMPLRMIKGERDEVSEILVAVNHGIGMPRFNINGVNLTAEQQTTYLMLQQEPHNGETMDEAIVSRVNTMLDEYELLGFPPGIGLIQEEIDSVVNEYRARARDRMFGITEKDPITGMYSFKGVTKDGAPIMYPETAREMAYNQTKVSLYGR